MEITTTTIDRDHAARAGELETTAARERRTTLERADRAGTALMVGQTLAVASAAVLAGADDVHYRAPALMLFLLSLAVVNGGHRVLRRTVETTAPGRDHGAPR